MRDPAQTGRLPPAGFLRSLIKAEQERGPDVLRLANALSALYPMGCEEKRLLDAMSLLVPHLLSAGKRLEVAVFDRITFDPEMMGGRACIRGMRIPVSVIVAQVAHGVTVEAILDDYPELEKEDVQQALAYAAWLAREQVVPT